MQTLGSETVALVVVADTPEPLFETSIMENLEIAVNPATGKAEKVRAAGLMLGVRLAELIGAYQTRNSS